MAVRNQHSRQSKNYIIENINGNWYYIEPETYQPKSLIYDAKKKIQADKLAVPCELKETGKTILVICQGGGKYIFGLV